ncbi:MAG: LysM peptidoglycan-binding domain-containing protein [Clostridia bacterium]|nr:LysM peptidoglycan-binding domain-containing protein [Clostridia bacterium]
MSCPIGSSTYEIRPGDTLAAIARTTGIPLDDILTLNPFVDPENLTVGQTICLGTINRPIIPCESGNYYVVRRGDSVYSIARSFELTPEDIFKANPNLTQNLYIGQILCIPQNPVLLEFRINISAKTLSVYREGNIIKEYPIATGKPATPTPQGVFTIINKQLNPGGPYGTRWLGLSIRGYGIHGTNAPESIGTAASNGCIRMFNSDIEELFDITNTGTVVRILP